MNVRTRGLLLAFGLVGLGVLLVHVSKLRKGTNNQVKHLAIADPKDQYFTTNSGSKGGQDNEIQVFTNKLSEADEAFKIDYAKTEEDSQRNAIKGMRGDILKLLADAKSMQARIHDAYGSCISSSTNDTVADRCNSLDFFLSGPRSHLGVEDALRDFPSVPVDRLARTNAGWFAGVSGALAGSQITLMAVKADPKLASDYGVSLATLEPLIDKAQKLQTRAVSIRNDNPVLTLVLLDNADLLLDDFAFRTHNFSMAQEKR